MTDPKKAQAPMLVETEKVKTNSNDSLDAETQDYIAKFLDISQNAKENDKQDKHMSLKEGLKTFPKAAMWSILLSTVIIMEGYDVNLLNSFYSFPDFVEKFGRYYPENDSYEIPAKWQTALSMAVYVGEIIGLFLAGIVSDRIGYRKTLMGSLAMVTGFIFIVFFAPNVQVLLVGEILLGLPWGAFQTLTVSYASEVCPTVLRLYLTTYVNACWVIGQLISSSILKGMLNSNIEDSYRIPFALQWVWPVPIAIGIYFAPESPWWLMKVDRASDAKKSLMRLLSENENTPDKEILANAMVDKMLMTIKEEAAVQEGISYFDAFKPNNWRRTRVTCMTWLVQNITGSAFMGYSTYFYLNAGLSTSNSFTFSIVQYVLGLIGTILSWFLSQKFGRFDIYFGGLCVQSVLLIVTGCLGTVNSPGASWGVGSLLLVFTFVYDMSVGPICYCLVTELPSTQLRTKTVILARNLYNLSGIVIAIIMPYMLNPTAWNWGAKTGFFWGGFAVLSSIWCWFELPETKGRTFAELDNLFSQGISARKFKSTEVEVFDVGHMMEKIGQDGIRGVVEDKKADFGHVERV
ncbi:sugar transporter [Metschnikowia bicuspidata var. bicuspidata NRRL YB-4993]|uniref:Sugar transporter n=1 Tax=Metschnikowia bicuspidata var. bicuspidata NRRL YB-4993 TaxID=869754 RepID=A0A1A0HE55_9ASCO|nr:sugar transporter [Metschnikowia bicuspidata var. bicuspidata NRRL YB-4993]OBA22270.1 sugar transporter [Metschnikowia bicuspidata var. bicuspidata NRRL YB-4993]